MMRILTTIIMLSASCAHAEFSSLDNTRLQLVDTFTSLANDGWGSGWSSSNSAVAIADTARTIEQFNDGYKVAYIDGANRTQFKTTEEVENSIDSLVGAVELDLFGGLERGSDNIVADSQAPQGIITNQLTVLLSETRRVNDYIQRTCSIGADCNEKAEYEVGKWLQPIVNTINGTINQVSPIYQDLSNTFNDDYTSSDWHVDGTVQGGFTKFERPDSEYRLPYGNSLIYGHAGYTAWALGEPVSFYYPNSTDHVATWRRSDWEAIPATDPSYEDILRLEPREGTRLTIEKWKSGVYGMYRIDYDAQGNEISKRQIGSTTTNFAAQHSNIENKYIDQVVPTWDRWDADAWTNVDGTDAYEYGQGAGTGRVVWNDDLQAFRGTYTTSGGSVINIEDSTNKETVLNAVRDHVDTWG